MQKTSYFSDGFLLIEYPIDLSDDFIEDWKRIMEFINSCTLLIKYK